MSKQNSGHTPKYMGPPKFISQCPECPINTVNPPMSATKVNVTKAFAKCKEGHTWKLGGK